jgi:hypothetical protein
VLGRPLAFFDRRGMKAWTRSVVSACQWIARALSSVAAHPSSPVARLLLSLSIAEKKEEGGITESRQRITPCSGASEEVPGFRGINGASPRGRGSPPFIPRPGTSHLPPCARREGESSGNPAQITL